MQGSEKTSLPSEMLLYAAQKKKCYIVCPERMGLVAWKALLVHCKSAVERKWDNGLPIAENRRQK